MADVPGLFAEAVLRMLQDAGYLTNLTSCGREIFVSKAARRGAHPLTVATLKVEGRRQTVALRPVLDLLKEAPCLTSKP
jgi:recombinational DNA repair protein (RecF pathway)